jgi:hypothetical protein
MPGLKVQPVAAAKASLFKEPPDARPTAFYTWRTASDERVRSAHAANADKVFAWGHRPSTGHPGEAHNCRCWPEPYYGTPGVPKAPLIRADRIDASGERVWSRINTATRPDGSLAESRVALRDGARVASTFAGSRVVHEIEWSGGGRVRVERRNGLQSVYIGESTVPVFRYVWTADGPKAAVPGRHVAQLAVTPGEAFDKIELVDPFRLGTSPRNGMLGLALGATAASGLLALYNATRADPESLGAGPADVAALAFKVWKGDKNSPLIVGLAALTAQQVAESCKRLSEVQAWTNEAARLLAPIRRFMSPQQWGTAVHKWIKDQISALRLEFPMAYANLLAEISVDPDGTANPAPYGKPGSTRLDVLEKVREDLFCVYDVKTGVAGLSDARVRQIANSLAGYSPGASFFVVEVRPSE